MEKVVDPPAMHPTKEKRRFSFTSLDDKVRQTVSAIILVLGGEMSTSTEFDPTCTHLIAGVPTRNEKVLGAIAIGIWVLDPEYLYASEQSRTYLPEEQYEWGNPMRMNAIKWPDERARDMAMACRRMRLKLKEEGNRGAFVSRSVLLYASARRVPPIRRMVESGGGQVCLRANATSLKGFTHALIDGKSMVKEEDLLGLFNRGTPCFKSEYLSAFLIDDPLDDTAYHWSEYRQLLKRHGVR